jgi:hypothetical protein
MHWRKGIGIPADAPAGLSSTAHRLTREVEIKSNGKGNSHSCKAETRARAKSKSKCDGDRVSDRRAFARVARCL